MNLEDEEYKYFTLLQERKLNNEISLLSLCPSMDIIAFSYNNRKNPGINIYRSLSWQRLIYLTVKRTITNDDKNKKKDSKNSSIQNLCWSPDGRFLAVAVGNTTTTTTVSATTAFDQEDDKKEAVEISLYNVDECYTNSSAAKPFHSFCIKKQTEEKEQTKKKSLMTSPAVTRSAALRRRKEEKQMKEVVEDEVCINNKEFSVFDITWSVMSPHPELCKFHEHLHQEVTWSIQSSFLDKEKFYLSSTSSSAQKRSNDEHESSTTLITCKTPLSLLCVQTSENAIYLYLHGQFYIGFISASTSPSPKQMKQQQPNKKNLLQLTSDLSTLFHQTSLNSFSLYDLSILFRNRYKLQHLSSHYIQIKSHCDKLSKSLNKLKTQWSDAIRPMSKKLSAFIEILQKHQQYSYSLEKKPLSKYVVEYILEKQHSSAFTQFFGIPSAQPQFMRLFKALETELQAIESSIKALEMQESLYLNYLANQLIGLVLGSSSDSKQDDLEQETDVFQLQKACQDLHFSIQFCFKQILIYRFRIKDLYTCLIGIITACKAEGTAFDSFERKNAKQKRMDDDCLQRVLEFFSKARTESESNTEAETKTNSGFLLDDLIGINMLGFLQSHRKLKVEYAFDHEIVKMFCLPRNDDHDDESGSETDDDSEHCLSIQSSIQAVKDAYQVFFNRQQSISKIKKFLSFSLSLKETLQKKNNFVESLNVSAVHKRLGKIQADEYHEYVGFEPMIIKNSIGESSYSNNSSQWILYAHGIRFQESFQYFGIQLLAFPGFLQLNHHNDNEPNTNNHYLKTTFIFPHYHNILAIQDISFYGDDGHSSLTPIDEIDNDYEEEKKNNFNEVGGINAIIKGGGEEGGGGEGTRQQMICVLLLVKTNDGLISEELWGISYHDIVMEVVLVESSAETISLSCAKESTFVVNVEEDEEETEAPYKRNVVGKRRIIRNVDFNNIQEKSCGYLNVSGSRGIAGVVTNNNHYLALYDLEENEEEDEDDDE